MSTKKVQPSAGEFTLIHKGYRDDLCLRTGFPGFLPVAHRAAAGKHRPKAIVLTQHPAFPPVAHRAAAGGQHRPKATVLALAAKHVFAFDDGVLGAALFGFPGLFWVLHVNLSTYEATSSNESKPTTNDLRHNNSNSNSNSDSESNNDSNSNFPSQGTSNCMLSSKGKGI